MRMLQPSRSKLIALALVPVLAFGPIGCGGPEFIPLFVTGCTVVALTAVTVHEIQEVQSAQLDIEMKTLRLEGMKRGQRVEASRNLTDGETQEVVDSGKVKVNGKVLVLRPE